MKWFTQKHIHGLIQMKRRYCDAPPVSRPDHSRERFRPTPHAAPWLRLLPRSLRPRLPWRNTGPVPIYIRHHPEF